MSLLLATMLGTSLQSSAQLIISQYVETNSGSVPKGIELWNQSGSTIDFSVTGLDIEKGTNGGTPSSDITVNTGTLADGDVMVIGTADMGTYLTGQGLGSVLFVEKAFTFNGDDSLVVKLDGVTEDVFGDPGSDPGSEWTGSGVSTRNQNIQLKSGITTGDTDGWTDPSERFETVSTTPATLPAGLAGFGIAPSTGADVTPPDVSSLSPEDEGTDVSVGSDLIVNFTEAVTKIAASGSIEIREVVGDGLVESISIDDAAVDVTGFTMTINPSSDFAYSTGYYVIIPAGLVEDAAGNDFPGLTVSTDWNFTTQAEPAPPSVVVNKYYNGVPDTIELLVVGDEGVGNTVDMRGMIIKDFSSSMNGDGGGKYSFNVDTFWEAVPVGTLIVLSADAITEDTDDSDFVLSIGLDDATYMTNEGGTLNIATTEMIMIKAAGSGAADVTGGIHAFGGGTAGSYFSSFTGPKLLSSGTTGSGSAALATNSTSTIDDFSGTDATSGAFSPSGFGSANNTENLIYLNALRGIVPGDGSGVATLVNNTGGDLVGTAIFDSAQTDSESVKITIDAEFPSITLTDIEITVPTEMGAPSGATLGGAGAGSGTTGVAGQVVTVSGVAVTDTDLLEVTINGLDTPTTTSSDTGDYDFTIKTAISAGTLTDILVDPTAYVIIPIEAIRDVDANGEPVDSGAIVAVEGVCTEAQFFTSNTVAYLQDGGFGVGLFNSSAPSPLTRARRYAVLGTVGHFNGVTQVSFTSASDVIDRGAEVEPAPLVITITDLMSAPETYEGRLVTVENLTRDPSDTDIWGAGATITMLDDVTPTPNTLDVYIASNSTALTDPGGEANITGIFSQDDSATPYDSFYRLMPREEADVQVLDSGYGVWIDGFYPGETDPLIIGFGADPDNDGRDNGIEALSGSAPDEANGSIASEMTKSGSDFTFLYERAKPGDVVAGITASYEWSTDGVNWQGSGDSFGGVTVTLSDLLWDDTDPGFDLYQVTATATVGSPSTLLVRVVAVDP